MAGWNLRKKELVNRPVSEDEYWSLFNYVFSDNCRKRSTYKFGLIKAILDSVFNLSLYENVYLISYNDLFLKFTENYWNLVVKYNLCQIRPDDKSKVSNIETIIMSCIASYPYVRNAPFESMNEEVKSYLIKRVLQNCTEHVVGALCNDFEGLLYGFDASRKEIVLNPYAYEFIIKHKSELEKLNYYSWARFLEKYNSDNQIVKVLEKLDLSTPRRSDLSIYRAILQKEFEVNNCFYCGKRLRDGYVHVDHFIPWKYMREDKMWNFVLSCSSCNEKKRENLAPKVFLPKLEIQNEIIRFSDNELIINDFQTYNKTKMQEIWEYAKMNGFKESKTLVHE